LERTAGSAHTKQTAVGVHCCKRFLFVRPAPENVGSESPIPGPFQGRSKEKEKIKKPGDTRWKFRYVGQIKKKVRFVSQKIGGGKKKGKMRPGHLSGWGESYLPRLAEKKKTEGPPIVRPQKSFKKNKQKREDVKKQLRGFERGGREPGATRKWGRFLLWWKKAAEVEGNWNGNEPFKKGALNKGLGFNSGKPIVQGQLRIRNQKKIKVNTRRLHAKMVAVQKTG